MADRKQPVAAAQELVFGIVAPLGVDLEFAIEALVEMLRGYAFETVVISISMFLHERNTLWTGDVPTYRDDYIERHQAAGDAFREKFEGNDALSIAAIQRIMEERKGFAKTSVGRRAYIIRQLKTQGEVERLRSVYGDRFVLLGIYADLEKRIQKLATLILMERDKEESNWTKYEGRARELIKVDQAEDKGSGQKVRDTFPLSDVFIELDIVRPSDGGDLQERQKAIETTFRKDLKRFLDLLFGDPFQTPTTEEFLMCQARAVALRSADWSRQVGAVIASMDGSIIAEGRNDDPRVGGGVMVAKHDTDPSIPLKREAVLEVLNALRAWFTPEVNSRNSGSLAGEAMAMLKGTRFLGLGEFGRMVHAEMCAISDAALRGVSTNGQVMFCTTFPCQSCAKHIMAAGIRVLVYMDPYPKSLVTDMYTGETLQRSMLPLNSKQLKDLLDPNAPPLLLLCTYLGVAPRRYGKLFSMEKRQNADGSKVQWNPLEALPRVESAAIGEAYLDAERDCVPKIAHLVK